MGSLQGLSDQDKLDLLESIQLRKAFAKVITEDRQRQTARQDETSAGGKE